MSKLTNTAINALEVGQYLPDDLVTGLQVRKHKTGTSWSLTFQTSLGVRRRPKLGEFPTLTIADARELARGMLRKVAAGEDPVFEIQKAKGEPTLDELWEQCEKIVYHRGVLWDKQAKDIYWRHISPALGNRRIRTIDYAACKALHLDMSDIPTKANHAMAVLSRMMKEARRLEYLPPTHMPCKDVERYELTARDRYATPEEIGKICETIDRIAAEQPIYICGAAFLYTMLFTGCRGGEVKRATPAMLERCEVKREDGTIAVVGIIHLGRVKNFSSSDRKTRGKNGDKRDIFIPERMMLLFDKMPAERKHLCGDYHLHSPRSLWYKVRKEVGCEDIHMHDLRRTFATVALSNGTTEAQLGELLGHKSAQTTKIYGKLIRTKAHQATAVTAAAMEEIIQSGRKETA